MARPAGLLLIGQAENTEEEVSRPRRPEHFFPGILRLP